MMVSDHIRRRKQTGPEECIALSMYNLTSHPTQHIDFAQINAKKRTVSIVLYTHTLA